MIQGKIDKWLEGKVLHADYDARTYWLDAAPPETERRRKRRGQRKR